MLPTQGLKNALGFYKYINWLYPVLRPLFPDYFGTPKELGLAMISIVINGSEKSVLNVKDIRRPAERV